MICFKNWFLAENQERLRQMHKENLVLSVIVDGKISRENSGQVYLPYGTEYSLRLKNLDASRRVIVKVNIDGNSATESSIVIGANSTLDLQGFLKGNSVKNSFKFIELTDRIRDHKGDRPDWGIISVSFQFEEPYRPQYTPRPPFNPVPSYPYDYPDGWKKLGRSEGRLTRSYAINNIGDIRFNSTVSSQGLTVPGTPIRQDFVSASVNALGPTYTISLQLLGQTPQAQPIRAVRTARRASCPTCGTKQRGNAKYCSECSTCLL